MTISATKDELQAMQAAAAVVHHREQACRTRSRRRSSATGKKRELVISLLSDKQLYDSGSADLKPETKRILDEVDKQL